MPAKKITTIEGLGEKTLNKVQQAWLDNDVPQCGYCQSGMIMAATALLAKKPKPTDADIDAAIDEPLPMRNLRAGSQGDPRRCGAQVPANIELALAPNGQKI